MQDLTGFDSKESRVQAPSQSGKLTRKLSRAPSTSPDSGPLRRGMLGLPTRKPAQDLSLGSSLQELDIDEEQVIWHSAADICL